MYIDEPKVDALAKDIIKKLQPTKTNADVLVELSKFLGQLQLHLHGSEVEKTANWLRQQNMWLKNDTANLSSSIYNYSKGSVIFSFELGTDNIGGELRYPHPGLVLCDNNEGWVIVAPITNVKVDQSGNPMARPPFDVALMPNPTQAPTDKTYNPIKPCVIQLDQIRRLDKKRIIDKRKFKLDTVKLDEVDEILLEYFLRKKFKLINNMQQEITNKDAIIAAKEAEIQQLKADIMLKNQEIATSKNQAAGLALYAEILKAALREQKLDVPDEQVAWETLKNSGTES